MKNTNRFFIDAAGIFIFHFYFGILQEKVTRGKYEYEVVNDIGEKTLISEKFTYSLTLVLVLCVINYIAAWIVLRIWVKDDDNTSKVYYISVATTYLLAMVCSNMALQWVPYPTQVVGKSVKPIPVMILGVLLGKKSYPFRKYLFVLLIVIGVVFFMFKDKADVSGQSLGFGIGEILLLLSLTMDGLTGGVQVNSIYFCTYINLIFFNSQERIRAESNPSGYQMMKATNGWSIIFVSVALAATGEGLKFLEFAHRYPSIINNLLILGVTQAIGQLFLYSMVSSFGPLVVSVVTTTRKFFTVLGSVLLFGNALSSRQWIGAVFVFAGLFLDTFFSKKTPQKPSSKS